MQEAILIIFYIIILLYSLILHEVFHGIVALWLGDPTAKYAGRITANPLKHIDPWMTILVPFFMLLMTNFRFAFGGAKPIPYNPYNLKNQKWGPTLVALAGPLSNIVIALIFAVIARLVSTPLAIKNDIITSIVYEADWSGVATAVTGSASSIIFAICVIVIFWNVLLAFFNLIPIPPLDGSKLLFAILPIKIETMAILEQFGFVILLFALVIFSGPLGYFLGFMLNLFLGITI